MDQSMDSDIENITLGESDFQQQHENTVSVEGDEQERVNDVHEGEGSASIETQPNITVPSEGSEKESVDHVIGDMLPLEEKHEASVEFQSENMCSPENEKEVVAKQLQEGDMGKVDETLFMNFQQEGAEETRIEQIQNEYFTNTGKDEEIGDNISTRKVRFGVEDHEIVEKSLAEDLQQEWTDSEHDEHAKQSPYNNAPLGVKEQDAGYTLLDELHTESSETGDSMETIAESGGELKGREEHQQCIQTEDLINAGVSLDEVREELREAIDIEDTEPLETTNESTDCSDYADKTETKREEARSLHKELRPPLYAAEWGPSEILTEFGLAVLSHKDGDIEINDGRLEVLFEIVDHEKFKDASIAYTLLTLDEMDDKGENDHGEFVFFQQKGNTITAVLDMDAGEFKMKISHIVRQGQERNICNYRLHCVTNDDDDDHDDGDDNDLEEDIYIQRVQTPRLVAPEFDGVDELRHFLQEAIETENIDNLKRAIEWVKWKGWERLLNPDFLVARYIIWKINHHRCLIQKFKALKQSRIAEIKSYAHPSPEIHAVMRGALLLLGNSEKETKAWKNVQVLIGKTGKMSIKRRIEEMNVDCLNDNIVKRAHALLQGINVDDIYKISPGAVTFYSWTIGIVEEFERRHNQTLSTSDMN